jgi:outer membrane receptor protein involved in Fe transport
VKRTPTRNVLASTISGLLALSSLPAFAQDTPKPADSSTPPTEEKKKELDRVVVTGSLIPISELETASPVTTITAEDIAKTGYRNVADVLRAQPLATGAVQDNQFSVGFTPGATTVSLLGLSPSFTLILVDGRPLADYPLLYNGQSNFTDLSTIPAAMVERIDILPGNQSAIYGSSAIAGVVNVILKQHIEGVELSLRLGGYDEGGGDNLRFQATGGWSTDKLDLTWGFQYSKQDPIWGYDRSWFDSTEDNPDPTQRFGSRTFLILDAFTNQYLDPGDNCDNLAANFDGTTIKDFRPGRGFYCGSRSEPGYTTILNDERNYSGYLNATWQLSGTTELYGSLLFGENRTESNGGSRFWSPDINGSGGYVIEANGSCDPYAFECPLNLYQHIFSPEETGDTAMYKTKSNSYHLALGARGTWKDDWDWDAYYARSQYRIQEHNLWPLTDEIEAFFQDQFLGPKLDTYYGYPIYNPDHDAFYQALTPQQYASFLGDIATKSRSWTHNINFQVTNANLWELPAGPVGFAALVQFGRQYWSNPTDPGVIFGEFWGITGTQGQGARDNSAAAVEFRVPVAKMLTANLSGRYDRYSNDGGGGDSKFTYKAGLEFRPMKTLLIRGNYATAFRAPDMASVFAGTSGFYTVATDYLRCEVFGQPVDNCFFNPVQIFGTRVGVPDLKSITADSFGYGFVWSPSRSFDLRSDYYNVSIKNEVVDLSINGILFNENECLQGRLDINSPTCVDALSRVVRTGPTAPVPFLLKSVATQPINSASEKVSGIVSGTSFRWGGDGHANYEVGFDYNVTLGHKFTQFEGDDESDLLHDATLSTEFTHVLSGDFSVDWKQWSGHIHAVRYGSTPNYTSQLGAASNGGIVPNRVSGWTTANLNLDYAIGDKQNVTLTINNLFDRSPINDKSYTAYPYYNVFNYNGYGRAWWVQYSYRFGTGDK